ncbi:type II CRISPR RNA-guided endonuclease Cas9 [Luteithermobacter gelatinilyticus]|uniref:type II CRISPR RNA-guided endonuclease Cas9 n=1 Tax=Luteithermobacter gelatinilyticus TaxID=2582913 RepID=UPI00143E039F|nr:type II CRISPR RNA-guided endonuclease Cas9 [Luteithermobacter gelatinilyticus]
MTKIIGVDTGIASVGYAYIDLRKNEILASGARIFDAAEHGKDGSSLALPRREKRLARRRLDRRRRRRIAVRKLLLDHGFSEADVALPVKGQKTGKITEPDVWQLRKLGLERKLSSRELAQVLMHINQRRGFQSIRKSDVDEKSEGGVMLSAAAKLQENMKAAGAETIGAYLAGLEKKRNRPDSYEHTVIRNLLRQEVDILIARQQAFGQPLATEALRDAFKETAFRQRPLQSSIDLVGVCEFEPGEKRAPVRAYSNELRTCWERLNSLRLLKSGRGTPLTLDQKRALISLAHRQANVTFARARKELGLPTEYTFNLASYRKTKEEDQDWASVVKTAEKATLIKMEGYHKIKKALAPYMSEGDWKNFAAEPAHLDRLTEILAFYEDIRDIRDLARDLPLTEEQLQAVMPLNLAGTAALSFKAIYNILPYLEQGLVYSEACEAAGYDHSPRYFGDKDQLPPFLAEYGTEVRNPVVLRALSQTRKVINALIREHGMPDRFHVELSRELGRNFKDRKDREREIQKRRAYNEELRQHAEEIFGREPSGEDFAKYKLWKEQNGICAYSGEYIPPETLKDPMATQVDHILPYSRSFDNSWFNKVLCYADENQHKGNETPVEYFSRIGRDLAGLEDFAKRLGNDQKARRLLMRDFDLEKQNEWKSRHLRDNSYVARLLVSHMERHLAPRYDRTDDSGHPLFVQTRNGALTSHLRHAWGLGLKDRDENDRHHGLDAIIVAAATQGHVQQMTLWDKRHRPNHPDDPGFYPPKPWPTFREDALEVVDKIFVSRAPDRKVTGAIHEDTIKSLRYDAQGRPYVVKRVRLGDLKLADLKNIVDAEVDENGVAHGRNATLYYLLKDRLDAHGGDAKKAFAEPVYMPKKGGGQGPLIRAVRLVTSDKSGFKVREGIASNGDMAYVKVYEKDGKFYLCPVYVKDVMTGREPDRLIVQGKIEEDWRQVDESYRFKFDLFKNDYVVLENHKEERIEGYYINTDRATGQIRLRIHDNSGKELRPGVQRMKSFEKYYVDVFGQRWKTS